MRQGDGLPQQRVAHAEDGSGGADAERQSHYRGDRETRRFAQHALAITNVLPQIHETSSPDGSTHGGPPWFEEFTGERWPAKARPWSFGISRRLRRMGGACFSLPGERSSPHPKKGRPRVGSRPEILGMI